MRDDNTKYEPSVEPLAVKIPVARKLCGGCSVSHIYRLADRGVIDMIKLGENTLITMESIRRAIGDAPRMVVKRGRVPGSRVPRRGGGPRKIPAAA
jgi:hypothetical protein